MSICIYKNKCNPAASARNVEYITRDSACESISFHNLDELRDDDRIQAKSNAINFAEQREIEEEARIIGNERGTPRNHNRMILSFDRKEETEIAKEEAHKFLDKNFPNQKAIVSVHQDQDRSHLHIWFDCRDVDTDRKTQIQPKDFYTLDEKWAKQYDERYGTEYEREYTTKKRETFEWKREQYERTQGVEGKKELPESKPARHTDNKVEIIQTREDNQHGMDKSADRTDEQPISIGHKRIEQSKHSFEQSKSNINFNQQRADISKLELRSSEQEISRSDSAVDAAIQRADELSNSVDKLAERELPDRNINRSRDRDDDYDRGR
jgi:hypothetical protein